MRSLSVVEELRERSRDHEARLGVIDQATALPGDGSPAPLELGVLGVVEDGKWQRRIEQIEQLTEF